MYSRIPLFDQCANRIAATDAVFDSSEMAMQTEDSSPGPSAEVVGNVFVEQYYLVLYQSPELVYRFYHDSSVLSRPGPDGVMTTVTTSEFSCLLSVGCGLLMDFYLQTNSKNGLKPVEKPTRKSFQPYCCWYNAEDLQNPKQNTNITAVVTMLRLAQSDGCNCNCW
ncbi:hypothetical protein CK203_016507 [Vitis vinifera]|uniref:NTF2 domain-containing protein n=1 Tax=Vitis vinifera TaxID=29760 RepID=A0A438J0Z1_VITVI|nr:hypothetical protein CK203_016507 [Vitis vinifera]